ncbi:MAG: hypothetical protein Q8O67_09630 [Deltaproteobacteria bacterium]|nr:hypothetical protein [Deltaproteobacteria bacterium]
MKPDAGKARDKARLAEKKAKKASAKAARKEAQAPASSSEVLELENHIKTRHGANRRSAFTALTAVDAQRAFVVVETLMRSATGKTLQELGGLLVGLGDPNVVDAAVSGRFGELEVWQIAPNVVDEAVQRLREVLPSLSVEQTLVRARALGVLPLRDAARGGRALGPVLIALLDDERLVDVDGGLPGGALRAALCDALVEVDPAGLWVRREGIARHHAMLAGLASRYLADDGGGVAALIVWLEALAPAARSLWLRRAGLPRSAMGLPVEQRVPLLRAVFLDESTSAVDARVVAWDLFLARTPAAHEVILARPDVAVAVTVDVVAAMEFSEAWSVVGALFPLRQDLRDAFVKTRHARHPELLDAVVSLLPVDPLGAMSFLILNDDERAAEEIRSAFRLCTVDNAAALFIGMTAGPMQRASSFPFSQYLALTDGGPRPELMIEGLRAFLPRAGHLSPDVDRAIDRLERTAKR